MSGRYTINGVDLSEITGGTTLITIGNFKNVPYSITQTPHDIRHGNNTANTTTNDTNDNGLNTYFCYHDDETPGIPFKNNGTSILQHKFSEAKIVLKNAHIGDGVSNVSIPSWCTGIKLYVKGKVGSAGNSATKNAENINTGNVDAGHVDVDININENNNVNGWKNGLRVDKNNNNNVNDNLHHHLIKRTVAVTNPGGAKGNSRTFWTPKVLPLDNTKTNTIYTNKTSTYNEIIINEDRTSKYTLKVVFGGDGGNATAPDTPNFENNENINDTEVPIENHNVVEINGYYGGSNGTNGTNGTVTTNITSISGCTYYDTLENSNTTTGLIEVYFFR